MKRKTALSNRLFRTVSIFFSALLLLMSLLNHVELMTVESTCAALEEKIARTEYETEILRVRSENRISLEELEALAVNQIGMHRPGIEQLYFGMLPG